jgi:hypothetical protein
MVFFEGNAHKFTDDEENKLEYTKIHEEYIYIIDEMIEGQLKLTFSEDEIDQFYADFKNNYHKFHAKNRDAVDILNCAIDFSRFKELMLKIKKGTIDEKPEEIAKPPSLGQQGMDRFWPLYNDNPYEKGSGWRKMMQVNQKKEGYHGVFWQRPSENSPIDLMRFDIKFKGATKDQWFEMLKCGPPIKNAVEKRVIREIGPNERIIYIRMKLPIMSDRENLLYWKRTDINEKESTLQITSIFDDAVPVQDKYVRADMFKCQIIRQDDEDPECLYVTDVSNMDMKGNFPSRLVNMAISSMMSKGVSELNNALKALNK